MSEKIGLFIYLIQCLVNVCAGIFIGFKEMAFFYFEFVLDSAR